jgi:hypothetical protein
VFPISTGPFSASSSSFGVIGNHPKPLFETLAAINRLFASKLREAQMRWNVPGSNHPNLFCVSL